MMEGTFTLGRNPDGSMVFVRVKSESVEIVTKYGSLGDSTVKLSKAQVADLIEVLK